MSVVPADHRTVERFREWATSRRIPLRTTIYCQASIPTAVYLVERGLARVFRVTENGREMHVGFRVAGAILGVAAGFSGKPHLASAASVEDCLIHEMQLSVFKRLLSADAAFAQAVHLSQSNDVREHLLRLDDVCSLSGKQRLQQVLCDVISGLCENSPTTERVVPLRRADIAQIVGISTEHLSRLLGALDREMVIRRRSGRIVVTDPDRLWHRER